MKIVIRLRAAGLQNVVPTGASRAILAVGLVMAGMAGLVVGDLHVGYLGLFLAALAGGVCLLRFEAAGLYLLAATLPVENVVTLGSSLTLTRALGVVVLGMWILRKMVWREFPGRMLSTPVIWAAILVLLSAGASVMWSVHVAETVRALVSLAMLIALSALVIDLMKSWDRVVRLILTVVGSGIVAAILVLEQYYIEGVRRAGDDIAGGVNGTASVLVSLMPFALYLLLARHGWALRAVGLLYVTLGTLAVSVTYSRTSYMVLGLLFLLTFLQVAKGGGFKKWAVGIAVASALALTLAPSERLVQRIDAIVPAALGMLDTVQGRGGDSRGFHWAVGFAVFADNPILGAGYNNYGYEFGRYQFQMDSATRYWRGSRSAHSSYIACLADQGLLGVAVWSVLLLAGASAVLAARRSLRGRGSTPAALLVQAVVYSFAFQPLYGWALEVRQNKIFWLILGLTAVTQQLAAAEPQSGPVESRNTAMGPSAEFSNPERSPRWAT